MKIFGTHDQNTIEQLKSVDQFAVKTALMADGHYGYVMPVGGVAAYTNAVSVNGVGFDIGCGNCAIKTDINIVDFLGLSIHDINRDPSTIYKNRHLNKIATEIVSQISFGIGRSNNNVDAPVDHDIFRDPTWSIIPTHGNRRDILRDKARAQLGTVGSGNHYVDIFVDCHSGHLWVGVHFGSRGLGHTIAANFLALGQNNSWGGNYKEIETILSLHTTLGEDYWELMNLAGQYAHIGREWVARCVMKLLGGSELDIVHNHHNFAWKESHRIGQSYYEDVVVVRKGATPAFPSQRGFVGGSMGDNAVILEGSSTCISGENQSALYSTVHGAGRVMSRTDAAGKRDRKTGELKRHKITGDIIQPGKISSQMMSDWIHDTGVVLRGGGVDESPHVYRRLSDVLDSQGDTIRILHTLRPLIVVMASTDIVDPYKD